MPAPQPRSQRGAPPRGAPAPGPAAQQAAGPGSVTPMAPDCNHVHKGIWLGGHKSVKPHFLKALGIKYVVNTARELKWKPIIDWEELRRQGIIVMQIQWGDNYEQKIFPSPEMNAAIQWVDRILAGGEQVLIHCAMGRSRSTSLVISYLMIREGMTFDQALRLVRSKRPIANPNGNFEEQLRNVEHSVRLSKNPGGAGQQHAGAKRRTSLPATPYGMGAYGQPPRGGGGGGGGGYMAQHPHMMHHQMKHPYGAGGGGYPHPRRDWDDEDDDDDLDLEYYGTAY